MSRGPGRIERAIRELFDANPERAFFTADLVRVCFPSYSPDDRDFDRAHEVSVSRAARKVIASDPDWRSQRVYRAANSAVFYNHGSMTSYALAQMIWRASRLDGRLSETLYHPLADDSEIWARAAEALTEPEYRKELTPPDGRWWLAVQDHCAMRDGDAEMMAALEGPKKAASAALMARLHAARQPPSPYVEFADDLLATAARLRVLAAHNDPDVIRQGLTEIADLLEKAAGPAPS